MTSQAQNDQLTQSESLLTPNNPRQSYFDGSINDPTSPTFSHISDDQNTPRPQMGRRTTSDFNVQSRAPHRRRKVARHGEHEWSVFEQVMEDGGQLRSTNSTQRRKIKSKHSGLNIILPTTSSNTGTMLGDSSVVQSPIQETISNPLSSDSTSSLSPSDSDTDSEESVDIKDTQKSRWLPCVHIPEVPLLYRNILKCAIAYFIASLFTYVTPLSHLIGSITAEGDKMPSPSGHMVATINPQFMFMYTSSAVYYNPARTMGAMFEANLYCLYGLIWAAFVGLGSMYMFWWIDVQPGWEWLADTTVIVWIGLGMTAVAWMKVWMAKPTFNTACSMTTIILFVVVVKEGGLTTLLQVARIVFTGAVITNCVCYLIWPQTASESLKNNMSRTLDSFATLLELLTHTFMLSDVDSGLSSISQGQLQRAVSAHQASFTSLKKSLTEARSEWMLGGKRAAQAYDDAVGCLNRLAQHINGLRSGTRLQSELAQAAREGRVYIGKNLRDAVSNGTVTSPISESSAEDSNLQTAAFVFDELVDEIGPPLNALSSACTDALRRLRKSFVRRHETNNTEAQKFIRLSEQIQRALFTFESTSNQALVRVYRRNNMLMSESFTSTSERRSFLSTNCEPDDENEILLHSGADETVFLVYYFIFTLQEFAKEMTALSDAMYRIYIIEHVASQQTWWSRVLWVFRNIQERFLRLCVSKKSEGRPTLKKRISTMITNTTQRHPSNFPKVRPHAPNTILTPSRENLSFVQRIGQSIWRFNERMKENHTKYALKAGMATALLASPAFFDKTRPVFVEYKGEWALISFFVVISPTIGATNFMSLHRVLGTILGATFATIVYSLFEDNPIVLPIIGFFFSLPCFYYIVSKPQYASSGRFVLLTYNLTCLYCYNTRQKDVPVYEIAYYRSLSVIIGVLYAFIVSRLWWPAEARRELSKALSEFCLNIGWLYTHLVAANSGILVSLNSPEAYLMDDANDALNGVERHLRRNGSSPHQDDPTERTYLMAASLSEKLNESIQTFMAMELHLQIKLLELQNLLSQTQHEPRLKGPFPVKMYRSILTSLQTIMDRLHSMRCVTTREEWFTSVKQDFVIPVNAERREMVGNVILYFSVLSAAFKLKTPLPPYLPPAEQSRRRLVEAIRKLDIVKNRDVKGSRQLLFFAYALTMKGVIQELDFLGKTLQGAFGVIGQTPEEFEAMFSTESRMV